MSAVAGIDLRPLLPELTVGLLALCLLVLDLLVPTEDRRLVGWTSIAGLIIALVPSALTLGRAGQLAVFNTFAVDPFAGFFKIVAVVSAILVIAAAMEFFRDHP